MKALKRTFILATASLFAVLSLVACGGGGGGGTTGTTTVSKGVIEKFGSVVVNGVEFKTLGAKLHLRDDATTPDRDLKTEIEIQTHLKKGMVVTVKGRIDDNGTTGTATEIEFRDTLKGRINAKGVDSFTVLGQTVLVDDSIKSVLNSLNINDDVQVSGVIDDKGGLRATHIEIKTGLSEFEVKGFVSGFTGAADTDFVLLLSPTATSGITVNIGAGVTRPAALANGAFVEIKTTTTAGGAVTATKIEIEDELKAGENENTEFEGFISSISGDNFVLNGVTVQTTATTIFVGGAKLDLAVGMKVEAEGLMSGSALVAKKVSFKDNLRINANATAVDTAQKTITILGKTVNYTSSTDFKNGNTTVDPATLVGKNIEIRGIFNTTGTGLIATRVDLKSDNPANDAFVRGVITAKTPNTSLTIAGFVVNTTGATTFKDNNDVAFSSADVFFAAATLNVTAVKARWNPFSGDVTAAVKEVELEN
jgi:hypothetical protein